MKIIIVDEEGRFDNKFISYVKDQLRTKFLEDVEYKKLKPFEIYINEVPRYKSLFKTYITAAEIYSAALYNIQTVTTTYSYILQINPMVTIPNTTVKVEEVCKLIDDGNLFLKAYPIFTKTFRYIQDNIEALYAKYELGEDRDVHKTL